ncbi:MAG: endonuclease III [Lachnospiraceae bacterium]|jgi:endonuclease-3|nr:endonuclease III [Lachnospiraceae bacterium]
MTAKRTKEIIELLDEHYGTAMAVYLHHQDAGQLLIATILSAQCTDARVNSITPDLFRKYPDMEAFAAADLKELEQDIRSTGFYHNKAKNIIAAAQKIVKDYGGKVPSDIDELVKIPGVGRKTANVIRGNIYDEPSIVVDTHVKRISWRLNVTDEKDPEKVEFDLMKKLPKDHWILWNLQIIAFGRAICKAQHPLCDQCFLVKYCREEHKNFRAKP